METTPAVQGKMLMNWEQAGWGVESISRGGQGASRMVWGCGEKGPVSHVGVAYFELS